MDKKNMITNQENKNEMRAKEITGSDSPLAGKMLMVQAVLAGREYTVDGENIDRYDLAKKIVTELKPQDHLEGMLVVQMIALHNMALECSCLTFLSNQTNEERNVNIKHTTKLISAFTRAVEVLDKHRGNGQTITVKHQQVNVESGGQAVIGDVNHGGGR